MFHELLIDFDFDLCFIDWGRHRHSSLSMSHSMSFAVVSFFDVLLYRL